MIARIFTALHMSVPAWAAQASQAASTTPLLVWTMLAIPFVWPYVKKAISSYIARQFILQIDSAIDDGDEDDDILLLAANHWIEVKAKKLGAQGEGRFMAVAANICSRIKFLTGREKLVAELAQSIVESFADAAQELAKEHAPDVPKGPC